MIKGQSHLSRLLRLIRVEHVVVEVGRITAACIVSMRFVDVGTILPA